MKTARLFHSTIVRLGLDCGERGGAMGTRSLFCALGIFVGIEAAAGTLRARVSLRDASNADRAVGASARSGIPQGHVLKVVVRGARFGRRPASGAEVRVDVRQGGAAVTSGTGSLDETGYGEVLVPVGADWSGQYHVDVSVTLPDGAQGRSTGTLNAEFRAIEAEPPPEIPFALPAALLALAAVALVVWWTRNEPKTV